MGNVQNNVIIVSAPSGYGKTCLAREFVRNTFSSDYWIEGAGRAPNRIEFLRAALHAVADGRDGVERSQSTLLAGLHEDDLMARVRGLLAANTSTACLVVDDVGMEMEWMSGISDLLASSPELTVLITTRTPVNEIPSGIDAFVITSDVLRFSEPELVALLALMHAEMSTDDIDSLMSFTQGQPALVVMTIPYVLSNGCGSASLASGSLDSVKLYVLRLIQQSLSSHERTTIVVASTLGSGTLRDMVDILGDAAEQDMRRISEIVPLVGVGPAGDFSTHMIVQDIVRRAALPTDVFSANSLLVDSILRTLSSRGRYSRLAYSIEEYLPEHERSRVLSQYGHDMFERGLLSSLLRSIESISPVMLLRSPRLIFLLARILRELGRNEESEERAAIARTLAVEDADDRLVAEISVFMARRWLETGREQEAYDRLSSSLDGLRDGSCMDLRAITLAFHAIAASVMGESRGRSESLGELEQLVGEDSLSHDIRALVDLYRGFVVGPLLGMWDQAAVYFRQALATGALGVADSLTARGNLAGALVELGRIQESTELVKKVLQEVNDLGLKSHYDSFCTIEGAMVSAIQGDYTASVAKLKSTISAFESRGEPFYAFQDRLYLSAVLRAAGCVEEALNQSQVAMEFFSLQRNAVYRLLAVIETAASLLACGDETAAEELVLNASEDISHNDLPQHALRVAAILGTIHVRAGRSAAAIEVLRRHERYITSGAANWYLCMFLRSFPELLSALSMSMPGGRIPRGLRRLMETLQTPLESHRASVCMLGSLTVQVRTGVVPASAWRKRKARVLFAMLAVRRGQDVPRDQILEHLWPDMDEERARNNFYVVWSAMKAALMTGEEKGTPCPYVENVHGACRIILENVRLDIDEFDEQIESARQAEAEGRPEEALAAYERVAELYRGELLPGDLYDDWFASAREHYRCEFTAAMTQAARLRYEVGDADAALRFIRAALAQDPWREDLYQAAIRYQMATGQRGAAIETYLACRSRLAEDLGLDPSSEMRSLYDQILAMEEPAAAAS